MVLDPRVMKDWEIAEAAEANMKPIGQVASEMGIKADEVIMMGANVAKIDYKKVFARVSPANHAKYIDVTAITPTPLGEGKTTTTIGLIEGLGRLGKRVSGAIRQPSAGPTFNVKGSAAGGGLAQCIPLGPFSIRLTGDIDSVTNANNLAMVVLTARMQHERNYDDARLAKMNLKRLDIDPTRIQMKWAMDFCAQSLRNMVIGKGSEKDGFEMDSGFAISVSSEVMAILAVARDLKDLRERMARIVVAYDKRGNDVTAHDLEVDGAMTAWLVEAINPNLLQTVEGQPVLVHAGPFANIAIGQSSIIADLLADRLMEYHVTESGFAADIGFEKFWNLKCRMSGLRPGAVVIVATIRALKMHGGGPTVKPGTPLDNAYTQENLGLVEKGFENLAAHIEIVKRSGVKPIVCINGFYTDTKAEIALVKKLSERQGAMCALSEHWLKGGEGACELAEAVIIACEEKNDFKFLYDLDTPLCKRIELIARDIYGADGVDYTDEAREKLKKIEAEPANSKLGTCMVKTHLSLSHNPDLKGRPRCWRLPIRDIMVFKGAGFVVPVAGDIKLMPGTASNPGFRRVDVDVNTGRVRGLF